MKHDSNVALWEFFILELNIKIICIYFFYIATIIYQYCNGTIIYSAVVSIDQLKCHLKFVMSSEEPTILMYVSATKLNFIKRSRGARSSISKSPHHPA